MTLFFWNDERIQIPGWKIETLHTLFSLNLNESSELQMLGPWRLIKFVRQINTLYSIHYLILFFQYVIMFSKYCLETGLSWFSVEGNSSDQTSRDMLPLSCYCTIIGWKAQYRLFNVISGAINVERICCHIK